jgi:hypothetical protein
VNTTEGKGRQAAAADTKTTVKKPYVKPEVRHERVFETMALSCGKVHTTQHSCHFNRKTS